MGTMLQARGLKTGALPELLCLEKPDTVRDIHREYVKAGADIITANTFGANRKKLGDAASVDEVVSAAVRLAKEAGAKKVALDMGPTGALLKPLGAMSFQEAYELFREEAVAGEKAGADLALIETMSDLLEAKAAFLAVRENTSLPCWVTLTFGADGRTFLGTDPRAFAVTFSALGADAIGVNCSLGPRELMGVVEELLAWSRVPVIVQPNAGLPEIENGRTVYKVGPEEFAGAVGQMMDRGALIVGGCCGTGPAHIALLRRLCDEKAPAWHRPEPYVAFASARRTVSLRGRDIALIGERINPTGKKKIKEALRTGDLDYILTEAISQEEAGAELLDVNAGLPEIDEAASLEKLVTELAAVTALPLQIDSSDPAALDRACRVYAGKPVINSVNGKEESLASILPIAKKYGAAVVGLTLDGDGIPPTAQGRFEIACRIVERAEALGIPREDILIDCLVMTVSTDQTMARVTLDAVRLVKEKLGVRTVLGVSNISFGLPAREVINAAFLAQALESGLDMPIMNPLSQRYMDVVRAHRVLSGQDAASADFIARYANLSAAPAPAPRAEGLSIEEIVLSGRRGLIEEAVRRALGEMSPMEVINGLLIPAINAAGERFDKGTFFLPQLMSSAETVKAGFDVVKAASEKGSLEPKGTVILATVKGDIHDIGKNIVKMLLINYGYDVIDLGRDVPPEAVVEAVRKTGARLVGLSALMTTTVRGMEETVQALRQSGLDCKIMVGGAVLTPEYAKMIGADFYARDAAESARVAEKVYG